MAHRAASALLGPSQTFEPSCPLLGADVNERDMDETWGEFDDALGALDGGPPRSTGVYMRPGGAPSRSQSEQGEQGIQDIEQKKGSH